MNFEWITHIQNFNVVYISYDMQASRYNLIDACDLFKPDKVSMRHLNVDYGNHRLVFKSLEVAEDTIRGLRNSIILLDSYDDLGARLHNHAQWSAYESIIRTQSYNNARLIP